MTPGPSGSQARPLASEDARSRWFAAALTIAALLGLLTTLRTTSLAQGYDLAAAWTGAVGALAALGLMVTSVRFPVPVRVALAWSVFMCWALVSSLTSQRVWAALVGESTSMLGWTILIALTAIALAGTVMARGVVTALRATAWLMVLAQAAVTFAQLTMGGTSALSGTLPNSTYLGEALVLLLPWTLPAEGTYPAWQRWPRHLTAAAGVAALAATGSRTAVVLSLGWVIWLIARRMSDTRARIASIGAAVTLVVGAALVFAKTEVLGTFAVTALGQRLEMWRLAALAVLERPVFGWGPDGFLAGGSAASTPELAAAHLLPVFGPGATDPHSLIAWVAVSTGIAGLALFSWYVVEVIRHWRRCAREAEVLQPALWGVAMCAGVLLTAPATPHLLPVLALVLGVSLTCRRDAPGAVTVSTDQPRVRILAGVLGLISIVLAANTVTRAYYEVQPYDPPTGRNVSALAAGAARAERFWFADAHLAYLSALQSGYAYSQSGQSGYTGAPLMAINRALELDAHNPHYALQLARMMRESALPFDQVDAAYRSIFSRYPLYPLARAEYAAFLAENARYDEAKREIAISRLADGSDRSGARAAALDAAEAMIQAGER